MLRRGLQASEWTLLIIITEDFFSSQTILVILDITPFFTPNTISAYRYLQPLPEQTRIFGHINYHKFVVLAAGSTKGKMTVFSLDFKVKPLSV